MWTTRVPFVSVVVGLCALSSVAHAAEDERPNVIVIMADDLGYECLGVDGAKDYKTPHLDKLAVTGIRFDRCYAQPLCTPTRNQMMTGIYNVRNYIRFGVLDPEQTTFGNLLRDAGYATCVVGKWQLEGGFEGPGHFGFDEYCLWQLTRRPSRYPNPGIEMNGREIDYTEGEYGPDVVNRYAIDFISRHKDKPFFLYYPMMLTHDPYVPTPDSSKWDPTATDENKGSDKKHFGEMVAYMDKNIGELVATLDELGLRERTLLLFTGDNGTGKGTETRWRDRVIVGGKGSMTEEGMRVPLIANWPGTIPEGQVSHDLVDSTDFLPTVCDAAGVEIPKTLPIDGTSFLAQLKGKAGTPRAWIYSWYWPRPSGGTSPRALAADQKYKLFDDGEMFSIDPQTYEQTKLDPTKLGKEAAAARAKLQAAIDRYASARPDHRRAADPGQAEGQEGKNRGKKRRKAPPPEGDGRRSL